VMIGITMIANTSEAQKYLYPSVELEQASEVPKCDGKPHLDGLDVSLEERGQHEQSP